MIKTHKRRVMPNYKGLLINAMVRNTKDIFPSQPSSVSLHSIKQHRNKFAYICGFYPELFQDLNLTATA
jgi:hypothetical protein